MDLIRFLRGPWVSILRDDAHPRLSPATICVGTIRGGTQVNIVPEEPTLDVRYGELSAMLGTQGVTVEWTTLAELGSVGFRVEVRRGLEASQFLPQLVPARGQPGAYQLLDASLPARRGESDAYRVHEIDLDGRGSVSDWVRVSTPLGRRSGELRGAE